MFHFLYKYFIKENVKSSQTVCHDEILSASVAIFHSRNVATGQEKFSLKKNSRIVLIWIMIQRRKESLTSMLTKVLRVRPRVVLFDSFGVWLCSRVQQPWCWSKRFLTLVVWWSFLPTFFPIFSQRSSMSVCDFHSWYLKIKRPTWTKSYDFRWESNYIGRNWQKSVNEVNSIRLQTFQNKFFLFQKWKQLKTLILLPLIIFIHKYCGYNERLARMGEIERS